MRELSVIKYLPQFLHFFIMFLFNKEIKSKEDIEIATVITNLMDSNDVIETLKKSINNDEKLPKVINVIRFRNKFIRRNL